MAQTQPERDQKNREVDQQVEGSCVNHRADEVGNMKPRGCRGRKAETKDRHEDHDEKQH